MVVWFCFTGEREKVMGRASVVEVSVPSDLRCHVPLMRFDDAGPVSQKNGTFVRCFYSLLGAGGETECRYLIAT